MKNIISIIFTVVGVAFIASAIHSLWLKAHIRKTWMRVRATIKTSDLSGVTEDGNTIAVYILYEYKVGEIMYQGDKISPYGEYSSSFIREHQYIIDSYPEGSEVMIYCHKKKPEESYLTTHINKKNVFFGFLMGIIVIVVGCYGVD